MGWYGGGGGGGGDEGPSVNWQSGGNDYTKTLDYIKDTDAVKAEQQVADKVLFYYDPNQKKFIRDVKRTDFGTYPTDKPVAEGVNIPYTIHTVNNGENTYEVFGESPARGEGEGKVYPEETRYVWVPFSEVAGKDRSEVGQYIAERMGGSVWDSDSNPKSSIGEVKWEDVVNAYNSNLNNQSINTAYAALNEKLAAIKQQNQTTNANYETAEKIANSAQGGDYVEKRNSLDQLNVPDAIKAAVKDGYKDFYKDQKLQRWNPALGAKPLYGDFDAKYYKDNNLAAAQQWKSAVANDDIDITERYGETNFYLQHYTTQGKPAGARGNKAEIAKRADEYTEKPTDVDIQNARDLQLGVDTGSETDRLLNIPAINTEWEAAKNGDAYWDKLAKEKYLDVNKPDEFAALFRLSERPEDKNISFKYNINAGYGITDLEDAVNQAVGEKALVDVKRFSALSQNVLKDTIAEMKKQKTKESTLSMLRGFGGVGEIMNMNQTLSNSLLGDAGIGGVLSMMGTEGQKQKESLEKGIEKATNITSNNTVYNWQKWFDTALADKYSKDIELGYSTGDATEQMKIDKDFASSFVNTYLKPRFDLSKSMDEFVEYLDVRQEEQNPFQTQDMVNAVTQVASIRSKMYLDQIQNTDARGFNPEFYFNPTGDKARENNGSYAQQKQTVEDDWEKAKNGDPYWASQAYRFGVDLTDKNAFARMHFEVVGQGKGYDPAEDILNAGKVQDQIYNTILPELKGEALKQGTVFGVFQTPEEFADEMLKGLDPNNKTTWDEVLKQFGMETWEGTIDELKDHITSALRSGTATDIRSKIKYLNEKRKDPTQQILGVTYIDRPEDFKNQPIATDDPIYKEFQKAGYQGSPDEFYQKFFPDTDPTELSILGKSVTNKPLKFNEFYSKDPWENLSKISSLMGKDETDLKEKTTTSTKDKEDTNFFDLGLNDEEDTSSPSKTGQQVLGDFASLFKGI